MITIESDVRKAFIAYKEDDKSFHFFKNKEHLGLCSYQAYKRGWYKDLQIICMSGNTYSIVNVWVEKYRLWPLLDWLLLSPTVECNFELTKYDNPMKFEEFQAKLVAFIKNDSYFDIMEIKNKLVEKVKASQNYNDLDAIVEMIH